MALLDDIKNAVAPIASRLAVQFKLNPPTPSTTISPTFSTPSRTTGTSATPLADELRSRFLPSLQQNTSAAGKIFDDAKTIAKKVGGAAASFFGEQANVVSDFAQGKFRLTPDDLIAGLSKTGVGTVKLGGSLAQGMADGVLRIGTSIADATLPGYEAQRRASGDSKILETITGNKSMITYQDIFKGASGYALDKGATPTAASSFGGFAVLGSIFMDEPGIGAPGKLGVKLGKDAVEKLVGETNEDIIKSIIKAENPKISDKAAEFMAPMFKHASTPEEVAAAQRMVNSAAKTAADTAEKKAVVERASAPIPDELVPLADRAKTFKTADEFAADLTPEDTGALHALRKDLPIEDTHPEFGDVGGIPKRVEDLRVEVSDLRKKLESVPANLTGERTLLKDQIKAKQMLISKSEKYFDAQSSARKTAVSDFHAKANAAVEKEPLPEVVNYRTAEVDPNLVKTLGAAKDPYEVLNVMKHEFPNLPDRVVDKIVERFTRTKRSANIENLIRSARNLDDQFKGSVVKTGEKRAKPAVENTFGRQLTKEEQAAKAAEKDLPPSAKQVLDKSVNPTVRKLMKHDQKIALIKTIKDKFEDPKEAVAAEHEYDRIWDDLNQKVVDEYENLSMHKSFLEDALSSDDDGIAGVYRKLFMGANKGNAADDSIMELQEIQERASRHKKALANYKRTGASGDKKWPGKVPPLTKTEEYAANLDSYLVDAGIENSGDYSIAQGKIERYAKMRAEVADLGKQLKDLKPRVKEARILQQALDEIAIVPREGVKSIDKLATQQLFRDEYKDITGFSGGWRDVYRNFEAFFGKNYAEIKKAVLDPFDEAKGRFVDTNKKMADDLESNITKKFGFSRGSKESAAIQRYGDTDLDAGLRMNRDDLVKEFGKEKADKIVEADAWFRDQYDNLIDELNVVRKKIYPNNPSKLISKKKNYYRHFREMNDTWGDALREFFDTPSGIDPSLAGLSEFTKAKTKFLPFAEARKTQDTDLDAIGGFVNYIPMFSYAKEIDPQISTFRYLRRKLAEAAPKAGEEIKLPNGKKAKTKGAENFITFLDDFARDLTGNTNPVDRYIQKRIPGGRKTIRAARFINNRMKGNTVAANFGSALAQIANVPAGIADTKLYAGKGLGRTLASTVIRNEPMEKSIFLKERYAKTADERFPFRLKDKPFRATGAQIRKQTKWILENADKIGTKFIWNSEYEKALGKGIEDPIKYADDRTRKMVAGRGIGEVPLDQKSVAAQFTIPFTLEVGNAWWIMKDWVDKKDFVALTTFFLANYMLNEAAEKIRGSRITIDPINSLVEGFQELDQERKEGNLARGGIKFLGRQAGEVLANIPGGQQLAAILPDEGIQAATKAITGAPITKQEVFGSSNISGRFGTPLIISGLQDAVFRLLPPVGGLQLKKTYAGIKALLAGHAEDSKGKQTFDVPATPQNVARALFFGANATSESRKFFDERTDLFNRIDRQAAEQFISAASAEDDWGKMKKLIAEGKSAEAADVLASVAAKDKNQAKAIAKIAAEEEKGLNANDRLIGMLNVSNGERAKYIVQQMKKLKTGSERADYLADLAAKKLVSSQVAKQIAALY